MTDVFISYARSTAEKAEAIAEALRSCGYGVWRDDDLPAHRGYAQVIEERLAAAKAVVVIWSEAAAKSEWVQSEADRARAEHKLVQVRVDASTLPMPFDRIQCADLTDWDGDPGAADWEKVIASVAELTGDGAAGDQPLPTLPASAASKPAVAIMPFTNLSSDPTQDYLADGMVEDIVAALARFKSIYVIAAGGHLVLDGKLASPHDAARRLGVGYLLEGSVRQVGGRVRITVHLIDAGSGAQVWSDRLDDSTDDIFGLQDRVAERVAGVIENTVHDAGLTKVATRPTSSLGSYDLYLRSLPLFRASRKAEMLQSIELLDQAIALDPNFAVALSQSAVNHRQVVDHEWCDDTESFRRRGLDLAERALRVSGDDAKVIAQVAAALPGFEGLDRALELVDRAIALNPASSFVWLVSGSVQLRNGQPELAAQYLETSIRLDPISSMNAFARMYLASARFQQERFSEALALFRSTVLRLPVSYLVLAALHGRLGQVAQAQEALSQFRALEAGPIEKFADIWFPGETYRRLLLDGIAAAEAAPA